MANDFFSRRKRLKKSEQDAGLPMTPGAYMLAGKKIGCPHCENDEFIQGSAQLNTSVSSAMLGVDYRKVHTLICTECGFLQWTMQPPKRIREDSLFY